MPIIEVRNVSKEFRLGQMEGLRTAVANGFRRLARRPVEERPLFKALDDVSFTVEEGEVLGIIGHNGAGKSTLLKLLAGISKPSRGEIQVKGRIAPLIEVGAGFVPDMTGRENVYLNGAILGLSRSEIDRKFDEIVSFAEMEEFIDTPVKRYSSGMKVKLAFSVATSVESEILIIDEILAVGDLAFQRKCFDRLENLISHSRRTVLVVSHNIRQVARICSRGILLDHGTVLLDDTTQSVCDLYYQQSNDRILADHSASRSKQARIESSGEAELVDIFVVGDDGLPTNEVESGAPFRVRIRFELKRLIEKPEIVVGTHTTDFVYLDAGSTASVQDRPDLKAGIHEIEYALESFPLVAGPYGIRFALLDRHRRMIFSGEALKTFVVTAPTSQVHEAAARMLALPVSWKFDGEPYSSTGFPKPGPVSGIAGVGYAHA